MATVGRRRRSIRSTARPCSVEIRKRLADAIHTGQLAPGTPLPAERVLCQEFGVARTSVREAIQGLVIAGYVERRGNRSVVAERLPEVNFAGDDRKALVTPAVRGAPGHRAGDRRDGGPRATDDERAEIAALAAAVAASTSTSSGARPAVPRRARPGVRQPAAQRGPRQGARRAVRLRRARVAALRRGQPRRGAPTSSARRSPPTRRSPTAVVKGALAQGRGRRGRPTSTTSSAAWWSGSCEQRRGSTPEYCYFFDEDGVRGDGPAGFRRRVILGDQLELWFWRITGGAGGSVPPPPPEQRADRDHHARRARLPDRRRRRRHPR